MKCLRHGSLYLCLLPRYWVNRVDSWPESHHAYLAHNLVAGACGVATWPYPAGSWPPSFGRPGWFSICDWLGPSYPPSLRLAVSYQRIPNLREVLGGRIFDIEKAFSKGEKEFLVACPNPPVSPITVQLLRVQFIPSRWDIVHFLLWRDKPARPPHFVCLSALWLSQSCMFNFLICRRL